MTEKVPSAAFAGVQGYLGELLSNSLDPGYAEAAARREEDGENRPSRGGSMRVLVVVACLVAGLVLAVAYRQTREAAPSDARARAELIAKVQAAEKRDASLANEANQLNGQVQSAKSQAAGSGPHGEALTKTEELAGTIAVYGPGLAVTMDNPPSGSDPNGRVLTDLDIRAVVNALWSAGAESISVNDVRLTPTSAIRFAGSAILVDFQPLAAPYTIRAIGERDAMDARFTASDVASKYRTLTSAFGFAFGIKSSDKLHLPASKAPNNRYAKPGQLLEGHRS